MGQPIYFITHPSPLAGGILRDVPLSELKIGLSNAFAHGAGKVVAVQSGIAGLVDEVADIASALLDKMDVVLGPAPDGQFYLFGIRSITEKGFKKLLDEVDLHAPNPLEEIMQVCEKLKLSIWVMETLGQTGATVGKQAGNLV